MTTKLTAKETALMTAIAENHFSFFDQGLVHGSGIWTECMTEEIAGSTKYLVSDTCRGVASVINSLGKKGLLITDTNEDGAWTDLSPAGEIWVNAHNGELGETAQENLPNAEFNEEDNSILALTRKQMLAELVELGYTGPTSYTKPRLSQILLAQR